MPRNQLPEPIVMLPQILRWLVIASLVGILAGLASAVFLVALDSATEFRESHVWIISFLPLAGAWIGWFYHRFGKSVEAGNNLIIDEIHEPKAEIPLRMAPLVLVATVATHLFGGSSGREGTAIQMGGSLADQLKRPLKMGEEDRRILLMAGLSAGFGSVFGTPMAGAIFGLEVLAIGRMKYEAIFPCFIAAIIGDQVTRACGIHHTVYTVPESALASFSIIRLLSAISAGVVFGLVGMGFAHLTHSVTSFLKDRIRSAPLRPFVGGLAIAIGVWALGSTRYIGLGIPTIVESFQKPLPPWDFAGKILFTTVTLGAGFKGGEVTPLFYIGATLGNALSLLLPLAFPLLAAMGFVAVFAGAANTPLSSTLMALELFGPRVGIYAGIACVVSYLFSGHAGIYRSQRAGHHKKDR